MRRIFAKRKQVSCCRLGDGRHASNLDSASQAPFPVCVGVFVFIFLLVPPKIGFIGKIKFE
jgi:hypothetical protein